MILPTQLIRHARLITPVHERKVSHGMTFGLGPAGYDLRIAQDVLLWPKGCALASTIEHVKLPADLKGRISDKSTWARKFVGLLNTRVDPGFAGFLTLEIVNHSWRFVRLRAGMPIAELEFVRLELPTEMPYAGRYMHQRARPQPALVATDAA